MVTTVALFTYGLARQKFTGSPARVKHEECIHNGGDEAGWSVAASDLDADGRDDLLCHDTIGRSWIDLANAVAWDRATDAVRAPIESYTQHDT